MGRRRHRLGVGHGFAGSSARFEFGPALGATFEVRGDGFGFLVGGVRWGLEYVDADQRH